MNHPPFETAELVRRCRDMAAQCIHAPESKALFTSIADRLIHWESSALELGEQLAKEKTRMDWLDKHCSFVADSEYRIGPFKVGQLREMADAGMRQDAGLPPKPTEP